MEWLILGVSGFFAWIISTLSGGGGSLLLVPVITIVVGAQAVAPIVSLSTLIAEPSRVYLFWKQIEWPLVYWYLPGAIPGAYLGAYIFTHLKAEWLQIILGIFLISTVVQYRWGEKKKSFTVKRWYFLLAGFLVALFSGIIGEIGPVLNPLYLNYGAVKDEMIGTKSVNGLVMQLIKLGTYTAFGVMTGPLLGYGLLIGLVATLANVVGKRVLKSMDEKRFRQVVITVMVVSGLVMIGDQIIRLSGP